MAPKRSIPRRLSDAKRLSREDLTALAHRHAEWVAMERGRYGWTPAPGSDDRLIVNMLRHCCTDYEDSEQSAADRAAANALIADHLPWLAAECREQDARRWTEEHDAQSAAAEYEAMQQAAKEQRRQWSADSRAAIKAGRIAVGQAVSVRIRGHQRLATVVSVARSKVTVAFQLKDGQQRTETLYACWCQPAAADQISA